jgi:beta-lactamase superfamily II metal-dependent hydrolase
MGKSNKRMRKRTRSWIALLLVLALLFAIDYFMGDPADVLHAFDALNTATSQPASAGHTSVTPESGAAGVLDVYVLDVGQGDSIFLRSPSGKTMLVDAGTSDMADRIDDFLQAQHVTRLDVVIGTHPHADHIGGMKEIISKYEVGAYYMPDAETNTSVFEKLLDELDARDIPVVQAAGGSNSFIEWDDSTEVRIFSPLSFVVYGNLNDESVVCRVSYGDMSILLTGDAESFAEEAFMKEIPARLLRSTVLKLGHHGSSTSTTTALLNVVRPELAVVSVGADNEYGHPNRETLNKLKEADIELLRTDLNGAVHIAFDGTAYTVETER